MPWGEHQGTPMVDVPPSYLLWLFRQTWVRDWPDIHDYLVENQDAIMLEDTEEADEPHGEFTSYEDYMRHGQN